MRHIFTASIVLWLAVLVGCADPIGEMVLDPDRAYVDARSTLLQSIESEDAVVRAHAVEAMAETLKDDAGHVFVETLDDEGPLVRFAAAMAIGDIAHAPAKEKLLTMAEQAEPDKRVLTAVVYALWTLQDDTYVSHLARMLFDDDKEVRANAAMAMGKMGEPSAIEPLRRVLRDEQDISVQMEIVEAMAALGDQRSKHLLEAYTKTQFTDDRLRGIQAMARIRPERAPMVFADLARDHQPPPVRVAALGALAQVREVSPDAYRFCVRALRDPERMLVDAGARREQIDDIDVKRLQWLAARALGWMDKPAAVDVLHPMLDAPDGTVRVAAAMSIIRLLEGHVEPRDEDVSERAADPATGPALRIAGRQD